MLVCVVLSVVGVIVLSMRLSCVWFGFGVCTCLRLLMRLLSVYVHV